MSSRREVLKMIAAGPLLLSSYNAFTQAKENAVAVAAFSRFLNGAEFQAETTSQRNQLLSALRDMATEPPEVLRTRRYADYRGRPKRWSLLELLKHHVVPAAPVHMTDELLFSALETQQGKATAREAAGRYGRMLSEERKR